MNTALVSSHRLSVPIAVALGQALVRYWRRY